MNHLVLAELLQKAGVADAAQTGQVLTALGNVSTNVSEASFRVLSMHGTVSDIDSRMAVLNATASALAIHDEAIRKHLQYMENVAASGVSCYAVVNPPVGNTTIIPSFANQPIRVHAIHLKGAVFHANPSRRVTFLGGSEELLACHVGASNAANAGVVSELWLFPNSPLRVVPGQSFIINPATGWTVQCTVSVLACRGLLEAL